MTKLTFQFYNKFCIFLIGLFDKKIPRTHHFLNQQRRKMSNQENTKTLMVYPEQGRVIVLYFGNFLEARRQYNSGLKTERKKYTVCINVDSINPYLYTKNQLSMQSNLFLSFFYVHIIQINEFQLTSLVVRCHKNPLIHYSKKY